MGWLGKAPDIGYAVGLEAWQRAAITTHTRALGAEGSLGMGCLLYTTGCGDGKRIYF